MNKRHLAAGCVSSYQPEVLRTDGQSAVSGKLPQAAILPRELLDALALLDARPREKSTLLRRLDVRLR